jgi:hypothetical protein
MTGEHLSSEEICRWMAGEGAAGEEAHVRECSLCGAEVARLKGALERFGGAAREWSAAQPGALSPGAWQADGAAHRWRVRRLRWSLAAATLVVLAVIPAWKSSRDRRIAAAAAQADAVLMEQVDDQVSRTVPETLEPLMNLVEWNAGAAQDLPGKNKGEEQ